MPWPNLIVVLLAAGALAGGYVRAIRVLERGRTRSDAEEIVLSWDERPAWLLPQGPQGTLLVASEILGVLVSC